LELVSIPAEDQKFLLLGYERIQKLRNGIQALHLFSQKNNIDLAADGLTFEMDENENIAFILAHHDCPWTEKIEQSYDHRYCCDSKGNKLHPSVFYRIFNNRNLHVWIDRDGTASIFIAGDGGNRDLGITKENIRELSTQSFSHIANGKEYAYCERGSGEEVHIKDKSINKVRFYPIWNDSCHGFEDYRKYPEKDNDIPIWADRYGRFRDFPKKDVQPTQTVAPITITPAQTPNPKIRLRDSNQKQ